MLATSQGRYSTHGFNRIHTLGKDKEGDAERGEVKEKEKKERKIVR